MDVVHAASWDSLDLYSQAARTLLLRADGGESAEIRVRGEGDGLRVAWRVADGLAQDGSCAIAGITGRLRFGIQSRSVEITIRITPTSSSSTTVDKPLSDEQVEELRRDGTVTTDGEPSTGSLSSTACAGQFVLGAALYHCEVTLPAQDSEDVDVSIARRGESEEVADESESTSMESFIATLADDARRIVRAALSCSPPKCLKRVADMQVNAEHGLITSEVLHSAELVRDGKIRAAWLSRPVPGDDSLGVDATFPEALRCARSFFRASSGLSEAYLDEDESWHAKLDPVVGPMAVVPDKEIFLTLLQMYCGGIDLESFPWNGHVFLSGGGCLAALAVLQEDMETHMPELRQATATRKLLRPLQMSLARNSLQGRPGSNRAAKEIIAFAGLWQDCVEGLRPLVEAHIQSECGWGLYTRGDIDFYFVGQTKAEAASALNAVRRHVLSCVGDCATLRTSNSVTLCPAWPHRHVQLITRVQESVDEILIFADLDCTALCYDGETLWVAPRTLRALELGYNLIPCKMLFARSDTPARVAKYVQRGFGAVMYEPSWEQPRPDVHLHTRAQGKFEEAKKLSKKHRRPVVDHFFVNRILTSQWRDQKQDGSDDDVGRDDDVFSKNLCSDWSIGAFLAKDTGYDEFHVPRGPAIGPGVVGAFFKNLTATVGKPLRVTEVSLNGTTEQWLGIVEWRRERKPEAWAEWGMADSGPIRVNNQKCENDEPKGKGKSNAK